MFSKSSTGGHKKRKSETASLWEFEYNESRIRQDLYTHWFGNFLWILGRQNIPIHLLHTTANVSYLDSMDYLSL